jgi:hypothetical protein
MILPSSLFLLVSINISEEQGKGKGKKAPFPDEKRLIESNALFAMGKTQADRSFQAAGPGNAVHLCNTCTGYRDLQRLGVQAAER